MPKKKNDDLSQQLSDIHTHGISIDSREVYVNGDYHSDDEINYMTSLPFIKNLQFLDRLNQESILVHMHIEGGCWHYGLAMMDAIYAVKSPVIIRVYSQASSMSGVLLQAAHRRIMMPNSYFLMHYGTFTYDGVSNAGHIAAKENEKNCKHMLDIFSERAMEGEYFKKKKMTKKQVSNFFDRKMKAEGDWYLSAEETIYYGLADEQFKK